MKTQPITMLAVLTLLGTVSVQARQVELGVELAQPLLEAEVRHKVVLKIALNGIARATNRERAPVNMALVLDKSGSMQGVLDQFQPLFARKHMQAAFTGHCGGTSGLRKRRVVPESV